MRFWVDTLCLQYAAGKRQLEIYQKSIDIGTEESPDLKGQMEYDVVSSMISDMQYAMEWMRRGRRPGTYSGTDRNNIYRRNQLQNMDLYPSLDLGVPESSLSIEQKKKLAEILLSLSERERECYILHMAYGLSITDISTELEIGRSTVQKFIERAKEKINKIVA